jgi:hypothetical protein
MALSRLAWRNCGGEQGDREAGETANQGSAC